MQYTYFIARLWVIVCLSFPKIIKEFSHFYSMTFFYIYIFHLTEIYLGVHGEVWIPYISFGLFNIIY